MILSFFINFNYFLPLFIIILLVNLIITVLYLSDNDILKLQVIK